MLKLSGKTNYNSWKHTSKNLLIVISDFDYNIPGVDLEVIKWTKESEIKDLQKIDIGVYPLTIDQWVSGKSGLKAIQYMALGLPVVASNLGCNNRVIENNLSGMLVNNQEEWIKSISQLIENPSLRKFLGTNARNRVENYFSIEANKEKYLSIFNKIY